MIQTIGDATLYLGDCVQVLPTLPENSVDSVVTDPPYHLTEGKQGGSGPASLNLNSPAGRSRISTGFMGKAWDGGDIAFQAETWAAVLRVAKPGAWMAAFASTRGYHRMVCAIEDAGWRIHPMAGWITGQGFPKASRVDAPGYEGFRYGGQVFKPAIEPICIAQKPFSEKTGTANVLKWGTGAVNVDAGRIGTDAGSSYPNGRGGNGWQGRESLGKNLDEPMKATAGRWPANLAHDGSPEVLAAFAAFGERPTPGTYTRNVVGQSHPGHWQDRDKKDFRKVALGYGDSGTAARFFYSAKASRADRQNFPHPTIKPVSLIRWLTRMLCPPGGVVLDPFAGTATGAQAALAEGMRAIAIEADPQHFEWCMERLRKAEPRQMELTA
jgi:site-specific DNA-methyltransferase (adenine-specific)